jgi:hypothetical protein
LLTPEQRHTLATAPINALGILYHAPHTHGGTIVNDNLMESTLHANDYMIINGRRHVIGIAALHGFSIYGNPLLTTLPVLP